MLVEKDLNEKLKKIKLLALDVDGVLTDGSFFWGNSGEEFKRFSFYDIMGLSQAVKSGLKVCLISGENSPLVERFSKKINLTAFFTGIKNKGECLDSFMLKQGLTKEEVCFIGDDINDVSAFKACGVAIATQNATQSILEYVHYQTKRNGGDGAVREVVEIILS